MQVEKIRKTKNYKETQKLGENLAKKILKNGPRKNAAVLSLRGNLGSGKTTFLQGFARGLGIKEKILSPTFVIQKKFQIPKAKSQINFKFQISNFKFFYHIDCYRLKSSKDILELGFKKIISDPKNIVAVEWPEKIKKNLPKYAIEINFKFIDKNIRELTIKC